MHITHTIIFFLSLFNTASAMTVCGCSTNKQRTTAGVPWAVQCCSENNGTTYNVEKEPLGPNGEDWNYAQCVDPDDEDGFRKCCDRLDVQNMLDTDPCIWWREM